VIGDRRGRRRYPRTSREMGKLAAETLVGPTAAGRKCQQDRGKRSKRVLHSEPMLTAGVEHHEGGRIRLVRINSGQASSGDYPAQAKGAKWPLRVPVESFHWMPKTLNMLRVTLASDSLLFTGWAVLSIPSAWPGATMLGRPSQA
jgi:hypothetical protein